MFRARHAAAPSPSAAGDGVAELLAEVRRFEVKTSRFLTDVLAGGYRSTFRGAGVEFSDVREYVEGDDPRLVDWNVSARVGRPFVKRFVEERELTMVFALDVSASMDTGIGVWSPRQAAARFQAVLSLAAIANHDRVGLLAVGGGEPVYVAPKKGPAHVLNALRAALTLRPRGPGTDLGVLLGEAATRLRRRTVVVLLSDFRAPLPERILQVCARRHDLVAVQTIAHEFVAPPAAALAYRDPETGRRGTVDLAWPPARAAFVADERRRREAIADRLHRAGVDRIDLELPFEADLNAVVNPLLRFFRRRELRQVRR